MEAAEVLRRLLEDYLGGNLKRTSPTLISYCHLVKYLPLSIMYSIPLQEKSNCES